MEKKGSFGKVHLVLACLLTSAILAACGPSQAELNAQATKIAANILATQTAEAPTLTPTPTLTSTPTPIPTPTLNAHSQADGHPHTSARGYPVGANESPMADL